jgi:thiol:disulfide interchange protein DsbA
MKNRTRIGLAALALLVVCACGKPPSPPSPPPAPAPTAPAATAEPAPPAAAPAAAAAPAPKAEASAKTDESKLERIAPLPAAGQLPAGKWVAGVNYRPLVPAQPTDAAPGKVEVVEMFWYGCPHCYALDPYLESWRKTKPAYIDFKRVPITWQAVHQSHARLFYALQALGKEEAVHAEVFAEMHDRKNYMYAQGNDSETLSAQVAFAKAHGISEADFTNAYNSFTVQTSLTKADELVHRYKVEGVPLMVINGKYVTDVNMAGNQANLISIVTDLAASEKSR